MIKIKEALENPKTKIIFMLIIVAIVAGACLKFTIDYWSKGASLASEIKKAQREIAKGGNIAIEQSALKAEIQEAESEIMSFKNNFFLDAEDLFTVLNGFAQNIKINLKNINPKERIRTEIPSRKDMYLELLPITLKIDCDYYQLINFLRKVEDNEKFITVKTIKIQYNPKDIWNHGVEIELIVPILVSSNSNDK